MSLRTNKLGEEVLSINIHEMNILLSNLTPTLRISTHKILAPYGAFIMGGDAEVCLCTLRGDSKSGALFSFLPRKENRELGRRALMNVSELVTRNVESAHLHL